MERHLDAILLREGGKLLRARLERGEVLRVGNLARDRTCPHRLGHLEAIVGLPVLKAADASELDDVDVHARILIAATDFGETTHISRLAPLRHGGILLLGELPRHLVGERRTGIALKVAVHQLDRAEAGAKDMPQRAVRAHRHRTV